MSRDLDVQFRRGFEVLGDDLGNFKFILRGRAPSIDFQVGKHSRLYTQNPEPCTLPLSQVVSRSSPAVPDFLSCISRSCFEMRLTSQSPAEEADRILG